MSGFTWSFQDVSVIAEQLDAPQTKRGGLSVSNTTGKWMNGLSLNYKTGRVRQQEQSGICGGCCNRHLGHRTLYVDFHVFWRMYRIWHNERLARLSHAWLNCFAVLKPAQWMFAVCECFVEHNCYISVIQTCDVCTLFSTSIFSILVCDLKIVTSKAWGKTAVTPVRQQYLPQAWTEISNS